MALIISSKNDQISATVRHWCSVRGTDIQCFWHWYTVHTALISSVFTSHSVFMLRCFLCDISTDTHIMKFVRWYRDILLIGFSKWRRERLGFASSCQPKIAEGTWCGDIPSNTASSYKFILRYDPLSERHRVIMIRYVLAVFRMAMWRWHRSRGLHQQKCRITLCACCSFELF